MQSRAWGSKNRDCVWVILVSVGSGPHEPIWAVIDAGAWETKNRTWDGLFWALGVSTSVRWGLPKGTEPKRSVSGLESWREVYLRTGLAETSLELEHCPMANALIIRANISIVKITFSSALWKLDMQPCMPHQTRFQWLWLPCKLRSTAAVQWTRAARRASASRPIVLDCEAASNKLQV